MKSNLRRRRGLQTEYAVRFSAAPGAEHPGNHRIYRAIERSMGTAPRAQALGRTSRLTNGNTLRYGASARAPHRGLLEAATPECQSARQLLVYQRAQQRLLLDALPEAQAQLQAAGFPGELGLLKNCRDAHGTIYGADETYDCELADGPRLWAYRAFLAALVPAFLVAGALSLTFLVLGRVALLTARFVQAAGRRLGTQTQRGPLDAHEGELEAAGLLQLSLLPWQPLSMVQAHALKRFGFRKVQHGAVPFLISRSIMTGCGVLHPDGIMTLSEKASGMVEAMRLDPRHNRRAILDTSNLLEAMQALLRLRLRDAAAAFGRRQTLQVGLGDSNVATVAEYLKIATTGLVIDMAEAGWLDAAPQPLDPVAALKIWSDDISLSARAPMTQGEPMSALAVQRYYLERAREWVETSAAATLEEIETVRMWGDVLDALERDPDELVGKLDWVTKHWLINTAGEDLPHSARMKIALRYHELGSGYLAHLEDHELAPNLLVERDVLEAMDAAPEAAPAAIRAEILRHIATGSRPAIMSWEQVHPQSTAEAPKPSRQQPGKVQALDWHRSGAAAEVAEDSDARATDPLDIAAVAPASNVISLASFRSDA